MIHDRTEGNPMFAIDLLRDLRTRGAISHQSGEWTLTQSTGEIQRDIPDSVRGMIGLKIAKLSDDDRRLLTAASVQGRDFHSAVVATVLGLDETAVEERLEGLDQMYRLIRLIGEHEFPDACLTLRWRFVHALYQNTFYESLRPTQRVAISDAVAQALIDHHGEATDEIATDLAYLFDAGRKYAEASDYFLAASRKAARLYANQEAATMAQRSIACAQKLKSSDAASRVIAATFHLAEVHQAMSQFDNAVVDFEQIETLAQQVGDVSAGIDASCRMAGVLFLLKRIPDVLERSRHALALAREAGSEAGVAFAQLMLS